MKQHPVLDAILVVLAFILIAGLTVGILYWTGVIGGDDEEVEEVLDETDETEEIEEAYGVNLSHLDTF